MFSIFKKRQQPAAELTFKTRVELFWKWYGEVAPRFYQTIEAKKCPDLGEEVSAKFDELLPSLAWEFGPGAKGIGHSLAISGEGVLHQQLLAIYCVSQAPKLAGWTFYAARQPSPIDGTMLEYGGVRFDALGFWISPLVNEEEEKVDITVWNPLLEKLEQEKRLGPLFIILDQALGEWGTGHWIGEIKINNTRLADAIPLKELPGFISKIQAEKGWRKLSPGEAATLYRLEEPHDRFLRGDVIVGTTMNPSLINLYLRAQGSPEDPLAGTGADYVFVSFDAGLLPPGKQSETRGAIEDALDAALGNEASGRLLGGAFGTRFAYIDLLLFDGAKSVEIVRRTLHEHNLPAGTAINYFAREKQQFRAVL